MGKYIRPTLIVDKTGIDYSSGMLVWYGSVDEIRRLSIQAEWSVYDNVTVKLQTRLSDDSDDWVDVPGFSITTSGDMKSGEIHLYKEVGIHITASSSSSFSYGFTSCGTTDSIVGITERFDDVANTHTARTSATPRYKLTGYSLDGYGFTSCGDTGIPVGTTERFDDAANAHTARTAATARFGLAGYSLNGYGFTSCGRSGTNYLGTTERFDDVANTHTARADATARYRLAGYSLSGYGFTSCGYTSSFVGTTERFDDVANTHIDRTPATPRYYSAGYSLSADTGTGNIEDANMKVWFAAM